MAKVLESFAAGIQAFLAVCGFFAAFFVICGVLAGIGKFFGWLAEKIGDDDDEK